MARAVWQGVDSIAEFLRARVPEDPPKRETWKPRSIKLDLMAYEPRFMPGTTVGATLTGFGTGLSLLDRPPAIPAQMRIIQAPSRPLAEPAGTAQPGASRTTAASQVMQGLMPASGAAPEQPTPRPNRDLIDEITDPFGELYLDETGELQGSQRGGGGGASSGAESNRNFATAQTDGGGSGQAPKGTTPDTSAAPLDQQTNQTPLLPPSLPASRSTPHGFKNATPPGFGNDASTHVLNPPGQIKNQGLDPLVGGDPMWVLDANKGIVVTPGTADNEFSNWSMDLRAQVSGANVSTYSWSTTNAPDATSITGASTYNLKFTWANFSGAARTDTIVVTETPTVGSALTQTLTFDVASTSSPAYTASAPTSAATWPNVITPDSVMADQQMLPSPSGRGTGGEGEYQVGLVTGELQTQINMPGYNPGVPAPSLLYSSLDADSRPIFIVHFPIDSSQAVPSTITAQLTLNGTTGEKFFYNTSQLNPGDIMQIALQGDATGLSTGRYSYSIAVTADYATPATTTYTGSVNIINDSSIPFGSGWSFDQVERLFPVTGGVILENPGGTSLWFASGTGGSFTTPAGDFSTLTLSGGVYTRTMTDGTKIYFNSTGQQTSVADRNGSTISDGYSSGKLVTITDPYNLVTTLTYTGSQVTSITDPANRITTLGYDASNRLTQVTQADGSLFTYTYDGTSGRILTIKNPDAYTTTVSYNFAERVSSVARPDGTTDQVSALQMQGLVQNYSTSYVAVAQSAISNTNTVNFAPTTSGDLLLAVWSGENFWNTPFAAPTTPTGWTLDKSISNANAGIYVYEKANASSIYSLSFSGEAVDAESVYFLELAGASSTSKDVSTTNSGTSTTPTTGTTATTSQANELALAAINMVRHATSSGSIAAFTSPTNGFTLDQQVDSEYANAPAYSGVRLAGLYKTLSATGTQSTGVTDSASHPWQGAIVTYKLSGAVSTPGTGATPNTAATSVLAAQAVSSYTDPRNNVWPCGFDWTGFGHVTQATDPLGNLSNTYRDANGLAWMTADQVGNRTRYNFDSSGNPTKVTNPDDSSRGYVYNSFAEATQVTDEAGNITTYTFDSNGNLTQMKDALSDITTYTNNSMGFRTGMIDPDGHVTTYTLDTRNRQTNTIDAAGGVVTMGYNSASNMTTQTNQRGYTTTFSYDGMGRQLTEALPDSNPSNHPVVTFQYDAAGNKTASIDPLGDITTTIYDQLNRPTVTIDPLGHAVTVAYDGNGNEVTSTDAVHGTTTFTFDAANREIATTNPMGQTTTLTLDADGRTSVSTDALNLTTTTTYTSKSQVYTVTDPLANLTTYAYSSTGQTTAVKTAAPASGGGGGGGHGFFGPQTSGVNWTYTYDALNRKATGIDPLGSVVTFVYDAASNQTAITDRLGHTTTYGYDALNRQVTTKDPLGDVTTVGYDSVSNKITQTDPLGRVTTYAYDAQNRLITVTDPRGAVTSYGYDLAGRQTSITDPDGNTTTYTFDAAGRKTAEQNPLGTATFAYDAVNQLTSETDKDGRVRNFTYYGDGKEHTDTWVNGGSTVYTATYTYNSDGWLKTEQDNYSTYSMSYDADGHLAVVDNNGTPAAPRLILTLTYDGLGNRTGLTDNYGGSISYLYDADSSRTWESMTVSGTQGPQVTLSYDADQRMTSILRATSSTGPTITSNYAYDNADRVTTITHSSSSAGALATYLYSYDAASQLQQYTGPEGTLTYTYDLSGELTNVRDARLETYSYDLNGNRNYGSYTTASDNRLTADGTYTFGYDAEGNMTSKTRASDGENWTYTWDDRNRLTQVVEKTSGGVTATDDVFTYDIENRRIGKSVNGTQSWFGYDGQNSYADFNGSGSLTMRYLTGAALDSLYARFDSTNTGWYLDDSLGSVRQVANTSGSVLDALTYDSYGQILSESNSANGDRFKYTSREWDSEIGQYHYRARSYSPSDGRFASKDPSAFAANDANLYRYVCNMPTGLTDPTGKAGVAGALIVGGWIAEAVEWVGGIVTVASGAPLLIPIAGIIVAGGIAYAIINRHWLYDQVFNRKADEPVPTHGGPQPVDADPQAEGRPHTVIGTTTSSRTGKPYRQGYTFEGEVLKGRTDVTDHGEPDIHPNPHWHQWNGPNGGWGHAEPVPPPDF
jgi:RHS repeat-associated protein